MDLGQGQAHTCWDATIWEVAVWGLQIWEATLWNATSYSFGLGTSACLLGTSYGFGLGASAQLSLKNNIQDPSTSSCLGKHTNQAI